MHDRPPATTKSAEPVTVVPARRGPGLWLWLTLLGCITLAATNDCVAGPSNPPLRVLTSINPLALIVSEAFGDLVTTEPLLPPRASPHFYTLRPSDIQRLADTGLFVWVGPELERFLPKVLEKSRPDAVVELLPRLLRNHPTLLLNTEGLALPDSLSNDVADSFTVGPFGRNLDAHLWMSKNLAAEIADEVSAELEALRPAHRETIRQRLKDFHTTLASLDTPVELHDVALVSYHNAFNYLARELGLRIGDVIVSQTDLTPGARHFAHLAERFAQQPHCLIVEPQFRDTRLTATLGRLASATVELDPMGANAPSYSALYRSWGMQLEGCGG